MNILVSGKYAYQELKPSEAIKGLLDGDIEAKEIQRRSDRDRLIKIVERIYCELKGILEDA